MEILTKAQSTDGYKNGRFGNHLRQWDNPDAALSECGEYCELPTFMIRYRGPGSNGPAKACPSVTLPQLWRYLLAENYKSNDLYVSERCPDDRLTFQGEIMERPENGGYALRFSFERTFQRRAFEIDTQYLSGPGAKLMCKQFMDHDSYEDLLTLFDLYPLHVVEFSCFNIRLGNLRRNTIFWEVRKF